MKSGASQTFHFNQHLAEKQEKKKRIPILRSSLGLHQMKTKMFYTHSLRQNQLPQINQCDITVSVCSSTDYIYHDVDL